MLFLTKKVREVLAVELADWDVDKPHAARLAQIQIVSPVPALKQVPEPPTLYVPQQEHQAHVFFPNVCYVCNKVVAANLDGMFQLTGCKQAHPGGHAHSAFSITHIECYGTYLANARQGKIQCSLCDSANSNKYV